MIFFNGSYLSTLLPAPGGGYSTVSALQETAHLSAAGLPGTKA